MLKSSLLGYAAGDVRQSAITVPAVGDVVRLMTDSADA